MSKRHKASAPEIDPVLNAKMQLDAIGRRTFGQAWESSAEEDAAWEEYHAAKDAFLATKPTTNEGAIALLQSIVDDYDQGISPNDQDNNAVRSVIAFLGGFRTPERVA